MASAASQSQTTPEPIVAPPNFPVQWEGPEEAQYLWIFDRIHAPAPITPADGSFFEYAYAHGITAACRELELPLRCLARRINTYPYLALVPISVPSAELQARGRRSQDHLLAAMGRLMDRWVGEFLPEIKRALADWAAFDLVGARTAQLIAHFDESLERTKRLYEIHMLVVFPPGYTAISMFDDLYRELFGNGGAESVHAGQALDGFRLLQGFENKTVDSGRALWALSRRALASPDVRIVLETASAARVPALLETTHEGQGFLAELRSYLDTYGQRGETWGWSHPTWIEDPTPVVKNLQAFVGQPDRDIEAELTAAGAERERLIAGARERLRTAPQTALERFEFLLRAAQEATVLSEDHGYWIDFCCAYRVRMVFLEIGRRLAAAGVLDRTDDVFYFTPDEIRETAAALPRLDRRPLAAARRAEMEYFRSIAPPPILGTARPGPAPTDPFSRAIAKYFGAPPRAAESPSIVHGNAGAPGIVRGSAKVVHTLAEAGKLQPGDVLVAATTAPPWTPLFATVAAVVTDTGGTLSHCAVVAREYGIPAVVGTGRATTVIRDGDQLEVDGDTGVVRLL